MEVIVIALAGIGALAGIFLVLDSALALAFGKRYMLWGLEYAPKAYGDLICRIATFTPAALLAVKLAELAVGIIFLIAAGCIIS